MSNFSTLVKNNFDFLKTEYFFSDLKKDIGYVKDDLELEFYQGKGEVEIVFFCKKRR